MDYEVGSIADLVSGQRTPNRRPVVCRVTTPRKQPPPTPLTPSDSPLVRLPAPKIAFTPETPGNRLLNKKHEFDSPKSEPRRRRSNLANNFRNYSQKESENHAENDVSNLKNIAKKKDNKNINNDVDLNESVKKNKRKLQEKIANDVDFNENIEKRKKNKNKSQENLYINSELNENNEKSKKKKKSQHKEEEFVNNDSEVTDYVNKKKPKNSTNENVNLNKNGKKNKRKLQEEGANDMDFNEKVKKRKKNKNKSQEEYVHINDTDLNENDECKNSTNDNDNIDKKTKKKSKSKDINDDQLDISQEDALEKSTKKKKSKLKDVNGDQLDISPEDALENTIEKQKKKLKLKEVAIPDMDDNSNDQQVMEQEDDDEGLSEFQKAAQRRINLKMKRNLKFEPDELSKTIFVGNVPLSVIKSKYKKIFKRIFSKYGLIESIRVRNVPVDDIKSNPKVALIEKKFHNERSSVTVYIKFQKSFSVEKALAENNTLLEGNHIRVDSCDKSKTLGDSRKTLFLGNLPFNVEEEVVRKLFEKCGDIKSIRLVRDNKTQIGKGFGFVNFEKADGVELALMMTQEDLKINGKLIRVHRYNLQHTSAQQTNQNNFQGNTNNRMGNGLKRNNMGDKVISSKHKVKSIGKKRDEFGNKIRKNKEMREQKQKLYHESKLSEVGPKPAKKSKVESSDNYKGLIAKKKKKMKADKGILKKKKISKILMQKRSN